MSSSTPLRSTLLLLAFLDGRFMVPFLSALMARFAAALAAHLARRWVGEARLGLSYGTIAKVAALFLGDPPVLGVASGCLQFIRRKRLGVSSIGASAFASSHFPCQPISI